MKDSPEPVAQAGARSSRGPGRRRGIRRTGGWLAATCVAAAATALAAAGPVQAANPPHPPPPPTGADPSVDHPQTPDQLTVIAPGGTGSATLGLTNNTSDWNGQSEGQMWMWMPAPDGTTFADATLTPVGDAPGGWKCTLQVDNTYLVCNSDYKGAVVPPGETRQWRVNLRVPTDAPPDYTISNVQAQLRYVWCGTEVYSPYMTMAVRTAPCPPERH